MEGGKRGKKEKEKKRGKKGKKEKKGRKKGEKKGKKEKKEKEGKEGTNIHYAPAGYPTQTSTRAFMYCAISDSIFIHNLIQELLHNRAYSSKYT